VRIFKNDFIELCGADAPASWDNFSVADEGVFVKRLDADQDALLTPSERKELERHPTGAPRPPALAFPCYLDDLEKFLDFYGLSSHLQQHTLLAWQTEKQGECKRANEKDSKLYWEIHRASIARLWQGSPKVWLRVPRTLIGPSRASTSRNCDGKRSGRRGLPTARSVQKPSRWLCSGHKHLPKLPTNCLQARQKQQSPTL
jgi:hypothetical protein